MSFFLLSIQLHECLTLQYVFPTHFFIISENADCLLCLLYLWISSFWIQTYTAGCITNRDHWEHIPINTHQKRCIGGKLHILLKPLGLRHFFHLSGSRCQQDAAWEFSPRSSSSMPKQDFFRGYEVQTAVNEGWKRGNTETGNVLSVLCSNNIVTFSLPGCWKKLPNVIKELGLPLKASYANSFLLSWRRKGKAREN